MKKIHIFYIQSNFHSQVARGIIQRYDIPPDSVYFVIQRNVPKPDIGGLIFDESGKGLKDRFWFYIKHKVELRQLFKDSYVCAYFPFDYYFPLKKYYDEYFFYEEGLSSYFDVPKKRSFKRFFNSLFKSFLAFACGPFICQNAKGFLVESSNTRVVPNDKYNLIAFSKEAYGTIKSDNVKKIVVQPVRTEVKTGIKNSYILVLDRLSSGWKPYEVNNYFEALNNLFDQVDLSNRPVYVKRHPADGDCVDSRSNINMLLQRYCKDFCFFDGSLEDVALDDNDNIFIGSNSTILFYAPIFGKTNKSVSFFRLLAKRDDKYREFLKLWGGEDAFCEMFSHNVECL